MAKKTTRLKPIPKAKSGVSYHRKPDGMSLENWQIALRKQFAVDKTFGIEKLEGYHPVFGDYQVSNFEKRNKYKVSIRDNQNSMNFCSCLDFKTNQLGTCKHIEAVLWNIQNHPRLAEYLKKDFKISYTSVYLSYVGNRKVKIRIGTDHEKEFKQLAELFFDEENSLKTNAFSSFEVFLEKAYALDADFRCYNDAMEFVLNIREQNRRCESLDKLFPKSEALQGLLKTEFFPYQHEGVLFAAKAGRALIADEMGLGKTIQAIGAAELLRKEQHISSVLIICPTSLKYQWQSEIERFSDSSVRVIEGLPLARTQQYTGPEFYKIVSYHTVINDIAAINSAGYDMIVLDEAQRIKNWNTKIALAVKKIKSPYCVVLTGTPLENKLEELYSIVQFIDPFRLGPYHQFLNRYQIKNDTGKIVGYKNLNEIAEMLRGLLLRRTKKEVLSQLPERMEKILFVPMTQAQKDMHEEFNGVVARLVQKWQRMGFLNEKDRQSLLINLNLMRMVCDSTYIVDQTTRHDTKINELMSILDECFEQSDEKVVVFSQWERMTRLVAQELDLLGIKYEYLHGGVPSQKRKALFDNFNNDPDCRVFLSTDAGSTGLNLQSASMLVNLDIPWNPAILEQRIARIHRLGQKKNVSIINFVSKDTIEERMLSLLGFKSSLAKGILDLGEDTIFMGDDKFRKFMQTVNEMTEPSEATPAHTISAGEEEEAAELNPKSDEIEDTEQPLDTTESFFDDDAENFEPDIAEEPAQVVPEPSQLLAQGLSFFAGLSKTLASPEKTAELVSSITEKDEKTGQTYLKIPVENQEVLTNVLNLVGQLFGKK